MAASRDMRSRRRLLSGEQLHAYGLLNKRVIFPYAGRRLSFLLSQSLFSSDDVDIGTKALLTVIAERLSEVRVKTVLDLGCGSGIIGIALSALWPEAQVVMSDRDALSVAVSRINALENNAAEIKVIGCLGIPQQQSPYDLIASNLPAKAGEPVLRILVQAAVTAVNHGHIAIVVIRPHLELVAIDLSKRAHILHRLELRAHTVFIAEALALPPINDSISHYQRTIAELHYGSINIRLKTSWGLPDFDSVPHLLHVAEPFFQDDVLGHRVLIWNPGQGLTACALAKNTIELKDLTVGSRDLLQIVTTQRNLKNIAWNSCGLHEPILPAVQFTAGNLGYTGVVAVHTEQDGPWWRWLPETITTLLAPTGRLLLVSGSTPIERSLRTLRGVTKLKDRRRHGCRAVLLERHS